MWWGKEAHKLMRYENQLFVCCLFVSNNRKWKPKKQKALIPNVSFFGVDAHLKMLEEMLEDWNNEEHLLLIGNQGEGLLCCCL